MMCVANPVDASAPAQVMCGANTALDSATNSCKVASSACLTGTMFDPAAGTCAIVRNYGTMVWSSGLTHTWHLFNYKLPNPPDGGSSLAPIGDSKGNITAPVAMDEPMFMSKGDPFGMPLNAVTGMPGTQPAHWFAGPPSSVNVNFDHQITVSEWKQCNGSWAVYKNPPDTTKHVYKFVVDFSGCPPDLLFAAWAFYGQSDKLADRSLGTPLGGLPQIFTIDGLGKGHFERNIDPNIYMKSGAKLGGSYHGTGTSGQVPDLTANPNATMWVDIQVHNNGQSNGNPGFCERDVNNNCITPPSSNIYLPGQIGVDAVGAFFGAASSVAKPIPLTMIQPY